MIYEAYTETGPRSINEDSISFHEGVNVLYVSVADGVGGLPKGKEASDFVTSEFKNDTQSNENFVLHKFMDTINQRLIDFMDHKFKVKKAGTTFTACIIANSKIYGTHTGDSRAYILRGNGLKQLTKDHSEAYEMFRKGNISLSDIKFHPGRNILTHIVGDVELFKYDMFEFDLEKDDRIILSTDGFHQFISKREIRDISIKYHSFKEFIRQLKIEIHNRVLKDNTSFVCIQI